VTPAPEDGSNPAMVRTVCMPKRPIRPKKGEESNFSEEMWISGACTPWRGHLTLYGSKKELVEAFRTLQKRKSLYHISGDLTSQKCRLTAYGCLTWVGRIQTITDGVCE
jgi:hypothetical protein